MVLQRLQSINQAKTIHKSVEGVKGKHKEKWKTEGEEMVRWRENIGLSRAFVARELKVGQSRLKRLEEGEPVRDAQVIMQAYKLMLEKVEMKKVLGNLIKHVGLGE